MSNLIYTGIGSRKTPVEIRDLMWQIAQINAQEGMTLRSGHAYGADWAFEQGARLAKGAMEIYLPWPKFNNAWEKGTGFVIFDQLDDAIIKEALRVAGHFHPAWDRCSPSVRKLHARNVLQIVGPKLEEPSDFVLCWTPGGKKVGGTATAIRIAEHLDVPVFNMATMSLAELDTAISALVETKKKEVA